MKKRTYYPIRIGAAGFFFPYKIGRAEFMIRNMLLTIVTGIPLALCDMIAEQTQSILMYVLVLILILLIALFSLWYSVIPRIEDIGFRRKLAFLIFIPFVGPIFGLYLMLLPGKK